MITPQTLAVDALAGIGEFGLDTFRRFGSARVAILKRLARCMTAAVSDIYSRRPAIFTQRIGLDIQAPVTLPVVSAIPGSKSLTLGMVPSYGIDGCTVNIGGVWNEVRQAVAGGTVTLLNEWQGASGATTMTVYGDSILLDSSLYAKVVGSVYRDNGVQLACLPNRDALQNYRSRGEWDYGMGSRYGLHNYILRIPCRPQAYWVENYAAANKNPVLRIRVAPLPDKFYSLDFDARIASPVVAVADIGTDATDPWATANPPKTFGLPVGLDESVLEDYFMAEWVKAPWFRDEMRMPLIAEARKMAERKLLDYSAQTPGGASMYSTGYC